MSDILTEAEVAEIEAREKEATPGPWYSFECDDEIAMNCSGVALDNNVTYPAEDHCRSIVAATLYQKSRIASLEDGRWDDNAIFIAYARTDIPRLIATVQELWKERDALWAEIQVLYHEKLVLCEMLRRAAWCPWDVDTGDRVCQFCLAHESDGHKDDCPLLPLLGEEVRK